MKLDKVEIASRPRRAGFLRLATLGRLTLLLLAAGLAWRIIRYAIGFPIWGDEASVACNLITRDYLTMLQPPLEYYQWAPLGFMWIELTIVKLLGFSEWSLRLPAFASGLLALILFWRFAIAVLDRPRALLAVAILAASYYPVRHSCELKPYSGDLLISLVMTMLAWGISRKPGSAMLWTALIATAAIGVWVSFPAAFVAGGMGLFLAYLALIRRSRPLIAGLAIFAVLSCASFAVMVVKYAGPLAAAVKPDYIDTSQWAEAFPPLGRPWLLPWWLLDIHAGNMMAYPFGGKNFGSIVTLVLVVIGCAWLWRRGRKDLLLLLLGPLIMTFLAACFKKYPYGTSARTMLFMAPAFCLLMAIGLFSTIKFLLPPKSHLPAVRIAAVALAVAIIVAIVIDLVQPYKRTSYLWTRQAVQTLAGQTSPGDLWVMGNSDKEGQFAPFIRGKGNVTVRFYISTLAPVPLDWDATPEKLEKLGNVAGRVWLLHYVDPYEEDQDRQERFAALKAVLQRRFGPPKEQVFLLEQRELKEKVKTRLEAYEFFASPSSSPAT